jgi:hypothetical protein
MKPENSGKCIYCPSRRYNSKGQLPARMVGNQRRLPLRDVLAYKADKRAKRRVVLAELAAHDQKLGLE